MSSRWRVEKGVFHLDGEPRLLACGDYPYFRDDADNWEDRLAAMRECGIQALATYVPWRHHAPEDPLHGDGSYDFDGRTQRNRDLATLLDIAREQELHVLLKPGPFVHAELPFGGLPNYVCPECATRPIEPERNGFGERLEWAPFLAPRERHVLPAPFDAEYLEYVRDWLSTLAREVLAPSGDRDGCVFAVQLMNEGIYSDSANPGPGELGFAPSTVARYRAFLRRRYGTLDDYRAALGVDVASWDEVAPPRAPAPMRTPRELIPYLDWSAFQSDLYVEAARAYAACLFDGGMRRDMPLVFNFNPNGGQWRDAPASNDGWYTRVNVRGEDGFTFGTTNWLGVLCSDRNAFHQYVMSVTPFRGPSMEQNWGFSTQYFPPYQHATPCVFESALGIACGATAATAYTFAGTRAWRDDPNLRLDYVPQRTNMRGGPAHGDYPGDAPVLSTGERTPKFWVLAQLAQYLRDEGPRFAQGGPLADVGWGIHPPYAWAGQWLPRGDADAPTWVPPLASAPHGAYHGLDAFVEMVTRAGTGFRQVDLRTEGRELAQTRVLCLNAHEAMDAPSQTVLAAHVERGNALLLTNLVPTLDDHMRPLASRPLARIFPHRVLRAIRIVEPRRVRLDGLDGEAFAQNVAFEIAPPADAEAVARMGDAVVGYVRRVGEGRVAYLAFNPWRATSAGDDPRLARADQAFLWALVTRLAGGKLRSARAARDEGEVMAWEHACARPAARQLFVVVRDARGSVEVETAAARVRLDSPSQCVQAVALEDGLPRAAYLRGTNDLRAERVAPRVEAGGASIAALAPCDLCVTRVAGGLRVSVALASGGGARVRLPVAREDLEEATTERGGRLHARSDGDGVVLEVPDVARAGAARLALRSARRREAEADA